MKRAYKYFTASARSATPLTLVRAEDIDKWLRKQNASGRKWARANGFTAAPGSILVIPNADGDIKEAIAGIDDDIQAGMASLPAKLPKSTYALTNTLNTSSSRLACLGWAMATYKFNDYKSSAEENFSKLLWPKNVDRKWVKAAAQATFLVRDLINTPAADMLPSHLAAASRKLGKAHGAKVTTIVGKDLLTKGYPAIHAVGRASDDSPRLIDMRWGKTGPQITLVGKGVCFDSGGLDLKPAGSMLTMKKDMGGAAHVLGLASMIMDLGLKIRLRVLVAAAENAVSSNAFRPLDVLQTRKGLTVEVGNTDAEGRLVLCDALAEAGKVDLLIDFATLTGAARVALGTTLPAVFCNNDKVAGKLLKSGIANNDDVWRLPLHQPYRKQLRSNVADLSNVSDSRYGGAITAALFLEEFVAEDTPWVHVDVMAWNTGSSPGRPKGGEAMGIRAMYGLIESYI